MSAPLVLIAVYGAACVCVLCLLYAWRITYGSHEGLCVCGRCESQEKLACVSMPVSYVCVGVRVYACVGVRVYACPMRACLCVCGCACGANLRRSWRACLCPCPMCVRAVRISGELVVRVYARVVCVCGQLHFHDGLMCVCQCDLVTRRRRSFDIKLVRTSLYACWQWDAH